MCMSIENKTNVKGTALLYLDVMILFKPKTEVAPRDISLISVVVFTSIVVILRLREVDVKREV